MSISTCALREEGDPAIIKITDSHSGFLSTPSARRATDRQKHSSRTFTISIHALREEGDGMCWGFPRRRPKFLSTPSARRATISGAEHRAHGTDFYPRPPRGGRPRRGRCSRSVMLISIHALREEGDGSAGVGRSIELISIHALREEGDWMISLSRAIPSISIHALREEGDRASTARRLSFMQFLSTPSARRATETCEAEGKYH